MKVLKINKYKDSVVREAVKAVINGQVLICPTDTVYGLITDATNKKAVNRIFIIKKREKGKPLPVFVKDLKMAKEIAEINKEQEKFLRACWPGAVTVILKAKKGKTIGLRIPDYKLILKIIGLAKKPLTGTSANLSGLLASGKIREVLKQFKEEQPDLVLDAGNLKPAKPSTVIDLTVLPPKVLRN